MEKPGDGQAIALVRCHALNMHCWLRGELQFLQSSSMILPNAAEDFVKRIAHMPTANLEHPTSSVAKNVGLVRFQA